MKLPLTIIILCLALAGKRQTAKDTLNEKPVKLTNGIYLATWSGYQMELQISDTSFAKVPVKEGCKCWAYDTKVKVENGYLFKQDNK